MRPTRRDPTALFAETSIMEVRDNRLRRLPSRVDALPIADLTLDRRQAAVKAVCHGLLMRPLEVRTDGIHVRTAASADGTGTVTFSIPYEGDSMLWHVMPSRYTSSIPHAQVMDGVIEDSYTCALSGVAHASEAHRRNLELIGNYLTWLRDDVERVNVELLRRAGELITQRADVLRCSSDRLAALGYRVQSAAEEVNPDQVRDEHVQTTASEGSRPVTTQWDVFICHASEDKDEVVRPLAERFSDAGVRVWYDEFELGWGDSLRRKIDAGLAESRYGIVVLSPAFFSKEWPQRELDGLVALDDGTRTRILPIWHKVTRDEVTRFSPTLADRKALLSSTGVDGLVDEFLLLLKSSDVQSPDPDSDVAVEIVGDPWRELRHLAVAFRVRRGADETNCLISFQDLDDVSHSTATTDHVALFNANRLAIYAALPKAFEANQRAGNFLLVRLFDDHGRRV